ncbi:MAG TPA: energy-coupling factor transporter transmembrane component T [Candidatus Limnocylindria bacterium]|nr:energy-coupling factor transporter transmembrane component T [Candidatus Limnocylindria bacterium]
MAGPTRLLFQPGGSLIHRVHPATKLLYAVAMTAYGIVLDQVLPLLALAGLSVLVIAVGGVFRAFVRTTFRYLVVLFVFLFIIRGLFYDPGGAETFSVGPLDLKPAGVVFAVEMSLRITAMVGAFLAVILTTHPADLVQAIEQLGASPRVGYIVLATLQLTPEMVDRARRIMDAQRSRGLRTEGSLLIRTRGLFPLVAPLFYGSLMSVEAKAMALTARGFFSQRKKTHIRSLGMFAWEPGFRIALVALLPILIGFRVAGWL